MHDALTDVADEIPSPCEEDVAGWLIVDDRRNDVAAFCALPKCFTPDVSGIA